MSKVPTSLKENLSFLKLLQETESKEQRQALLETATPSQIRALSEICQHSLYGFCKLNKKTRKRLRSKVKSLKKIASPARSYKSKKERIGQYGGSFFKLLGPLLGAILPAITSE
jgi:hypothetical protein